MIRERNKRIIKSVLPFAVAILTGLTIGALVKNTLHPAIVNGISMMPTYKNGTLLRSLKDFDEESLEKGTVIVLSKPGKSMVKRIIALPGETVQIENGYVYINGRADHDFDFDIIDSPGIAKDPVKLGQNEYFVLGDNRNYSNDSRMFGPVNYSEITAVIQGTMF